MTFTAQVFGTKKCRETRAAERFFRERGVAPHVVDLAQKGMSPGELRNVAARVGGFEALIDREGKRYVDKGLKYAAPTGPRIEQMLIADPLLLIHGMADDNVVLEHSTVMMAKLQGGAVPFETMLYPGQTHKVGGPGVSAHLWKTILDFLDRNTAAK